MAGQQGQPKYGFGWPDGRLGSTTPVQLRECVYIVCVGQRCVCVKFKV